MVFLMVRGWMSPRHPPSYIGTPLGSAHHRRNRRMDKSAINVISKAFVTPVTVGKGCRISGRQPFLLVLLLARLLPAALASQRFFHALFLAGFQVVGVSLYFLDDVFLLNFALKPAQRILQRLTFLQSYICQIKYTPKPS